ncbi:DJ-1/PfpI family protein [Caenispirillum bisanense]|uniref:DJ-1/PfpI family protein n=1 Tax=Caenispirillum bisanense TaxID=414052 RepID=UPI0031D42000
MGTVAILLTDRFADWESAYVTGIGRPFYGIGTRILSPDGGPVASQGGVTVVPDGALATFYAAAGDVLLICGGLHWQQPAATDVGPVARQVLEAGGSVAGICAGTLALARAGLLDSCRHTSNDPGFLTAHAPGYRGGDHYVDSPAAVRDGRIITAPGTAPATFAAEVFRAAGVAEEAVSQFLAMLAAEFRA